MIDPQTQQQQIQSLQARKFQSRKQRGQELQTLETQKVAAKAEQKTQKEHPQADKRYHILDMVLKKSEDRQDALIEVMHKAQETFGYLDDDVLTYVTRRMKLPLSVVYGVATFYHLFSLKPQGEHNCVICLGTACYVKGGGKIMEALEQLLGIKSGETTEDGKISLITARCMGACGIAPAITIDGNVAGKQNVESVIAAMQELINSGEAQKIKEQVEALTA